MDNLPPFMLNNRKPAPEPTWDGSAGTIRQFIRNFTWLCKRYDFPLAYHVQEIMSYIPPSQFVVWENVAQEHPIWDNFVKKILEYYPQPSLADSSGSLDALISTFKVYPEDTKNKDRFFSYLRQFTIPLSAIECHRTVPNSEKVSRFSEGLAPIIRKLVDKHKPQDMNEVIAAGNAVFDYIVSLDSETKGLFNKLVESSDLEMCQRSVIYQGYTPLSSANRDEPGLSVLSHGQTNT
ncbi:hypothetical protein FA15DRAFT_709793 [Coprinopsis marcescibilis]|uniref:Uncharacterized protein n=1 Tax=Coprinopsis marcescibilis TaxID=230819 RepID=A0A5C3KFH8_COPMA|nr:hypothetical protein FA15DRAFT_709793 [Coprinopsis marcescibilis]